MDQTRKIQLVAMLAEAEKDVSSYRQLLAHAEESVRQIKDELNQGYAHLNTQYSSADVKDVRRCILLTLSQFKAMNSHLVQPKDLVDELNEHPSDLVMRELHNLAKDARSDVYWNNRRGPASRYGRKG